MPQPSWSSEVDRDLQDCLLTLGRGYFILKYVYNKSLLRAFRVFSRASEEAFILWILKWKTKQNSKSGPKKQSRGFSLNINIKCEVKGYRAGCSSSMLPLGGNMLHGILLQPSKPENLQIVTGVSGILHIPLILLASAQRRMASSPKCVNFCSRPNCLIYQINQKMKGESLHAQCILLAV